VAEANKELFRIDYSRIELYAKPGRDAAGSDSIPGSACMRPQHNKIAQRLLHAVKLPLSSLALYLKSSQVYMVGRCELTAARHMRKSGAGLTPRVE